MATSVWKGYLAFGMVAFPVKLCAAARSLSVSFHQLHPCGPAHSRIKQVLYCQAEDKPVSRSELARGFEYEKDRYVILEDRELDRIAPESARVMEILEFVPAAEIDPVYLEASYYILPEPAGEKPYTLLFECLRRAGYVSIAQLTMHHREHTVVLRPGRFGLVLHTMYYHDEVRAGDEFRTDTSRVQARELELANLLLETLATSFEATKYRDSYREKLRELIDAKVRGQEVVARTPAAALVPVIDILEALKSSLAKGKKGGATAEASTAAAHPSAPAKRRKRA